MKHKIRNNLVMVVFRFNEPSFMTIAVVPGGMYTCLTHCILVDSSTFVCWMSWKILLANNVDPDQMSHNMASDLDLHCLPTILLWVSW